MPEIRQEVTTFPRTRQGLRDLDRAGTNLLPVSGGPAPTRSDGVNVGPTERIASLLGGGALAGLGLSCGSPTGLCLALVGAALAYRGLSGHCHLYEALGVNTAGPATEGRAEYAYRAG
jgi:hypothetical protein